MTRKTLVLILWFMPTVLAYRGCKSASMRAHLATGRSHPARLRQQSREAASFQGRQRVGTLGSLRRARRRAVFMDAATAHKMLAPKTDYAFLIDALKNFKITQGGSDQKLCGSANSSTRRRLRGARVCQMKENHALRHTHQWRTRNCLCEGRQDRPHHTHRSRRGR